MLEQLRMIPTAELNTLQLSSTIYFVKKRVWPSFARNTIQTLFWSALPRFFPFSSRCAVLCLCHFHSDGYGSKQLLWFGLSEVTSHSSKCRVQWRNLQKQEDLHYLREDTHHRLWDTRVIVHTTWHCVVTFVTNRHTS
jgi:hypothetical protein